MPEDYSQSIIPVKSQSSLTAHSMGSNLRRMNFGDRLKRARSYANLTQQGLADKSGVKQGTISKIERGDADSSTFIVQLSKACGVSSEWLAVGDGQMLSPTSSTSQDEEVLEMIKKNPALLRLLKVAEPLAEYQIDSLVSTSTAFAKSTETKNNGTQ